MNQTHVFNIMIDRNYGDCRFMQGIHIIGTAMTYDNAIKSMHKAYHKAKREFVSYMRDSGDIAYREYDGEKIEAFDEAFDTESRRIEMYIHDGTEQACLKSVTVYIQNSEILFDDTAPAACENRMGTTYCDLPTGIYCTIGHWNLEQEGFVMTAKLRNSQNRWIQFWKNIRTGEVAIRLERSKNIPDRIFQNRNDGNLWFKTYIKPMHGANIIRV